MPTELKFIAQYSTIWILNTETSLCFSFLAILILTRNHFATLKKSLYWVNPSKGLCQENDCSDLERKYFFRSYFWRFLQQAEVQIGTLYMNISLHITVVVVFKTLFGTLTIVIGLVQENNHAVSKPKIARTNSYNRLSQTTTVNSDSVVPTYSHPISEVSGNHTAFPSVLFPKSLKFTPIVLPVVKRLVEVSARL